MNRRLGLTISIILGLATTSALAQKVTLDYAHDFDFSEVKTFQYVDTKDTNISNSLMSDRVIAAIKDELSGHGLTEADNDGDLLVTYHYSSQQSQTFTTTSMGMRGAGAGWGRWGRTGVGMGSAHTTVNTFTEGTLVIDAYDPQEEKLVWRGSGAATVKGKPEKQMKQIERILAKLGVRWDKIVAGKGK